MNKERRKEWHGGGKKGTGKCDRKEGGRDRRKEEVKEKQKALWSPPAVHVPDLRVIQVFSEAASWIRCIPSGSDEDSDSLLMCDSSSSSLCLRWSFRLCADLKRFLSDVWSLPLLRLQPAGIPELLRQPVHLRQWVKVTLRLFYEVSLLVDLWMDLCTVPNIGFCLCRLRGPSELLGAPAGRDPDPVHDPAAARPAGAHTVAPSHRAWWEMERGRGVL